MARSSPEKLAAALRANLKRRKQSLRDPPEPRPAEEPPESPPDAPARRPDPEKT